jgi:hypothetical protein
VAGQLASSLPSLGIPGARDPRERAETRPDPRPPPLPVTQRLARSGPARTGRHAGSPASGARAGAGGPDAPTSVPGSWPAPPGSAGDG